MGTVSYYCLDRLYTSLKRKLYYQYTFLVSKFKNFFSKVTDFMNYAQGTICYSSLCLEYAVSLMRNIKRNTKNQRASSIFKG